MCNRRFANAAVGRKDRHLQSVVRIARYVAFYAAFISFYIAPHQRLIASARCFIEELYAQFAFRVRRLRDHQ